MLHLNIINEGHIHKEGYQKWYTTNKFLLEVKDSIYIWEEKTKVENITQVFLHYQTGTK